MVGRFNTSTSTGTTTNYILRLFNDSDDSQTSYNVSKGDAGSTRICKVATGVSDGTTTTYTGNDGKSYLAIAIDEVYWLQYNLAETRFRDGSIIPWYGASPVNYFTNAEWAALTTAGCCAYDNTLSNVGPSFTFPT